METFIWKIRAGMKKEAEPRVRSVKFGDGYEQRRPDGINTHLKKYTVSLSMKHALAHEVEAFFERHNGVSAFLWKPPHQDRIIKIICRKWSTSSGAIRTEIDAEFEEVVR
nr:phage tail protein [Xenorhabdus thuongxuanensis]